MKEFYIDGMAWWLARLVPPVIIILGIAFGAAYLIDYIKE